MSVSTSQDILHDALGEIAGSLVLLEHDANNRARFDIFASRRQTLQPSAKLSVELLEPFSLRLHLLTTGSHR